jgi:radical SAM protein with 4Fe4S-binding SPASM domain
LLKNKKFRSAYNHIWVSLFTRNAGVALLDPLIRLFPQLAPYPKTLEIEVTTRCHLKCLICEHTYWKEPPRDMSFDEFKRVVDQFPKLKWIGMTGIGSSFLNKDYLKMLRYLKSRDIYVELYDSFDQMNEEIIAELIDLGIEKIYLSMEAATKETYEKIRVGASFERVIDNVRKLAELKREKKTPFPELWFHYIINKLNLGEMSEYVELVHSLVGDDSNYATLIYWTRLLDFKEVKHLDVSLPANLKKDAIEKTDKYGIYNLWNEDITRDKPITKCTNWTEPFVLVTGHVQPCCVINEANERNYQKEFSFGNLFEEDFRDIWRSSQFKEFKSKLHQGKMPSICKNCRIHVPFPK